MKLSASLLIAPVCLFLSACSTHYSASSHHGYRGGHSGVSVGVHGHHRGGGRLLGAMIVGGVIGHILTEAANAEEQRVAGQTSSRSTNVHDDTDALVNGYSSRPVQGQTPTQNNAVVEETQQWYQKGEDGSCYLMKNKNGQAQVISAVPNYTCD